MLEIEIREGPSTAGPIGEVISEIIRDIAKAKIVAVRANKHMDIVLAQALLASTREKVEMLDRLGLLSDDECEYFDLQCNKVESRINERDLDIKREKLNNNAMRRVNRVRRCCK